MDKPKTFGIKLHPVLIRLVKSTAVRNNQYVGDLTRDIILGSDQIQEELKNNPQLSKEVRAVYPKLKTNNTYGKTNNKDGK